MHRTLLAFTLFLCATPTLCARPNIIFLFADDQRADTIAAHGNPNIRTPHLDRVATRSFSFRDNYCFGANSGAVCVPSRAMVMTGKMWMRTNNKMRGETILPELLGKSGYRTFATGKWHNGAESLLRGFQGGKTLYLGGMSDHTRVPVQDIVEAGKLGNKRFGVKFSSELFADEAIDFIEGHEGEQPFFLYVAFTAPHDPRQPPLRDRRPYYRDRPPLPPNFLPQHPFDNGHMAGGRDENLAPWPRTEEIVRDQLAEYYGLISHLDSQVGRIVGALESSRFADDTILVYAADHGLAIGSHGLLGKQSVYEHSMKCPLMISGPGIPKGKQTSAFTYLIDLYPTLCGLADVRVPDGLDGKDLRPLWTGEAASVRSSVFLPFRNVQRAVRDERWKLIVYPQINHRQLFDLANDPHETRSLADDPAHAATVNRMLGVLGQWRRRFDDELPLTSRSPKPKEIDLGGRERLPDRWQPDWIRSKYFGSRGPSERNLEALRRLEVEFGPRAPETPNFVLVFCDDLGYGDLGSYGHPTIRTPNLDRLAREGQRWTSFYSAASVCTPSRAALLTGRYPIRSGMCAERPRVLTSSVSKGGIPQAEVLLPEALKTKGYATACIGKWHLGHHPRYLPTNNGFDHYFGLDASNDHNARRGLPKDEADRLRATSALWNNKLYRNTEVVEQPADQRTLTRRYTEEAVRFIERSKDRPFLLYMPHTFPHTPLFASPDFLGKSPRGLYGDVVEELDWSVGRVVAKLEELGLEERTLVIFTSDNGPWLIRGTSGGSAGLLREGKGSTWEGGMRVPAIFRWPGKIRPGIVDDIGSTMDIYTTLLRLAGADVPDDRIVDGLDLSGTLLHGSRSPRRSMIFYRGVDIHAVRNGNFKAHFLTRPAYGRNSRTPTKHDPPLLYDLAVDPSEKHGIEARNPRAIDEIRKLVDDHNAKLVKRECELTR